MSHPARSISLLAFALCLGGTLAHAQNASVYFGGGYATDGTAGASTNLFTGATQNSPSLNASFGKIGGDFMFSKRFGFGAETDFAFSKENYLGFNTRPIFYDFNGIYVPFSGKYTRVVPEISAGIGGEKMTFSYTQTSCDSLVGCSSSTTPYEAANHFQLHVGVALKLYATKHLFVRPAFDYHYVPNYIQYGSNSVPEFGAAVGWSFGEH